MNLSAIVHLPVLSSSLSTCKMCNNRWTMGAKKTAVMLKKATPLYKAKSEENTFAPSVFISATGPIPVKIKHDIWKLSNQLNWPK